MTELLDEAHSFPDASLRRSLRELVLEQLARSDPERAWAFFEPGERADDRGPFLQAWAWVDAAGALAWAERQDEGNPGHVQAILAGLVPDDVEAFAAILPQLKPGQVDENQLSTAFRLLGAEDSGRALKLLDGLEPGTARNAAASSLAEGWARSDADSAYAWARDLSDPAQRESAMRGVFRAWAESDPQRVAEKIDELAKDELRNEKVDPLARGESPVRAIVRAWAAQDPKAAAAWLRNRPEDDDDSFKHIFASEILPARESWPATDLAEMVRRPGEKPVTDRKDRLYNSSMSWSEGDGPTYHIVGEFGGFNSPIPISGLSDQNPPLTLDDPAKSFDELSRQPADAARQHVLQEVASQWVARDPQAALAKLRETKDEFLSLGLINALANAATQNSDPALAAEVAKAFPADSWQGRAIVSQVFSDIARLDPERAQTLLVSESMDAENKATLASALAEERASYDPAGAIAWAAAQADEAQQSAATRSAVGRWAEADAYAVSEWLTTQPAGPMREAAVQSLIGALAESSPEEAIAWAGSLTDPKVRENEQENLVMRHVHNDPRRARRLAEQIPFSEEARQRVMHLIEMGERRR
jgi:hypothetical protein